jgi:hypothetical protein
MKNLKSLDLPDLIKAIKKNLLPKDIFKNSINLFIMNKNSGIELIDPI